MIGQTVGHYEVEERLGGGGMGVVYRARDLKLGRAVALKFLSPHLVTSDRAKQRFIAEARAASALDHPAIATIHAIEETKDGELYIVMAYYEGETIAARLARRGAIPVRPSRSSWRCRRPTASPAPTSRASSTATSSPPT